MSRRLGIALGLFVLLLGTAVHADEPVAIQPAAAPAPASEEPPDSNLLCPEDECDGSGGGGGTGCYECTEGYDGAGVCYTGGKYWRDCAGGWICWYMPGAGSHCQAYCGRYRCYNA